MDASQTYEAVWANFNAWYPRMRKGGLFCIHNYKEHYEYFGVRQATNEIAKKLGVKLHFTKERYNTAYFLKPSRRKRK